MEGDTTTITTQQSNNIATNTAKVSADGSINTHSDVDTSTTAPQTGDYFVWDGSNWVSSSVAPGASKVASFMSTISQNVGTLLNGIGTNIQITLTNILGPNSGGFTITSGNVIIQTAGWYKVSMKGLTSTTTNLRQNTGFVVKRNSIDIAGTKAYGYIRNTSNNTASTASGVVIPQFQFAQGDIIGLYAISGGDINQTSFTTSQECILTLELIQ